MSIYNITNTRSKLFEIVDEANTTHRPIYIKRKRNNAVIISESDYESTQVQETMYISVPGLADAILKVKNESIDECISHKQA